MNQKKLTFDLFFTSFMEEYNRSWNEILGYAWLVQIQVRLIDRLHMDDLDEFDEYYNLITTNHPELSIETTIGGKYEYINIIKRDDVQK